MYFIELPINSLRDGESHILQFARKLASAAYGKKSGEDGNLKKTRKACNWPHLVTG